MAITLSHPATLAPHWRRPPSAFLRKLGEILLYLAGSPQSRRRQADALAALDDRLLSDIGLTRADVPARPAMPDDGAMR